VTGNCRPVSHPILVASHVLYCAVLYCTAGCRCDEEFFMDEVGLEQVPEGDWFCTTCTVQRSQKPQPSKGKAKAKKVAPAPAPVRVEAVRHTRGNSSKK
jgi:hypothetical protein